MLSVDDDADVSIACDDVASLIYFPYTKRSQTVQTATKRRFSLPASATASALASASAVSLTRFFVSFCRAFAGINVDVGCGCGCGFGSAGAKHSLNGALLVQCCQTLSVLALSVFYALSGNAVPQLFQAQLEQQQQRDFIWESECECLFVCVCVCAPR